MKEKIIYRSMKVMCGGTMDLTKLYTYRGERERKGKTNQIEVNKLYAHEITTKR